MSVLSIENLSIAFPIGGQSYKAVKNMTLDVNENETLCIVGESGCGKSITALSVLGLQAEVAKVTGKINFGGRNLLELQDNEMEKLRGDQISMIFQEPMTSLNPVYTIGRQLAEPLMYHKGKSEAEALREAKTLLDLVRIPDAAARLKQFPHQLSGGMRQRVMIAMGLACKPRVLIADEPTTALDVTIQAQVLNLLISIRKEQQFSLVLITHDLGVVANIADRVAVMYAGEVVETAPTDELFAAPRHPYTQALFWLACHARIKRTRSRPFPGMCRQSIKCQRDAVLRHDAPRRPLNAGLHPT
ncbi:ABC transporter ATP-binding protein [Phaeobacter sp. J2-8]|uniref:ABC transporter ATP-binding protein n=1 Tax=Phaeobacter sp. J2-8 TaxID=2931394 RepID=UPI001FD564BF|nr:ABC transporter ATP-binding protein [Phaeobacter sp. J2-8]MCJ7871192.1 ABC transporter ATP-binding protein [Phaeobacter sp. J2-8]